MKNSRNLLGGLLSACLGVGLVGCASLGTYNPATERKEVILISTATEVQMGLDLHKSIAQDNKFSTDTDKAQRLKTIGENLAAVSDRQDYAYQFYLIESDELNAFTTPGGNVYFYSTLFDKLENDDAIAAVIAHEIGHCAARHIAKKFQASLGYSLAGSIILNHLNMGEAAREILTMSTDAAMGLIFSAFSRKDEYEADRLSVKYLYLAGYDLNGIIKAFGLLLKESKGPQLPLWLRTHPYLEDRIKMVEKEIIGAPEKYRKEYSAK